MGTGIAGAILLDFVIEARSKESLLKNSADGFLDNYELLPETAGAGYERYAIKNEVLLPNYSDFLAEFYGLIYGESDRDSPFHVEPATDWEKLFSCKTREQFDEAFDHGNRGGYKPVIQTTIPLSCMSCYNNTPFLFYGGSYKAILEEYTTLVHMEKMLVKAMRNPLRSAVKFGIFG